MMAEFLHELTKKREENARIDAMIIAQGGWDTQEEVMPPAWERALYTPIPRPLTLADYPSRQDTSWDIGEEPF
jgi:hypothetical protein